MSGGRRARTRAYLAELGGMSEAGWAFEDPTGRLVAVNGAFCLLLDVPETPAEISGTLWRPRVMQLARAARDPGAMARQIDRLRTAGRSACDIPLDDGRIMEVEHAAVALPEGETGHVWRLRDVTVARTHVSALRDAVEIAERANDSRRSFLAGLSHELRTPVNAIMGMSDLVAETTLDGDVRELVVGIDRNARRLVGLLDRLLSFAGAKTHSDSLSPSPFSPIELVDAVAAGHTGDAGPMLLCRRGPDVPQRVVGDRSGIEHILRHLLAAAADVESGVIEVGVEAAPGDAEPGEGGQVQLRFFVRDTVDRRTEPDPAAVLDRIFWQGTTTREEPEVGRQIVYGLVGRFDGTLDIRPGVRGTLFDVRCRLVVEVGPDLSEPLADRRVLIADPHHERRALHAEQCLEWGAAIRTATDADSLAAAVADGAIDCALVADPLIIERPDTPWVRLAEPGQLDVDVASCVWRLGPTPQRAELLAGLARCLAEDVPPPPGPARVLLVEDLPDNAALVCRFLEQVGHQVQVARTGAEALYAVRSDAWDIVLMDINLPDIDGIEVTRRLRAFEARARLGQTPAVALTAYTTDSMRTRAEAAGLRAFLTKPIDRRILLDAIARHGRRGPVGLIVDSDPVGRLLLMRRARRRSSLRLRWSVDGADARAIVEQEPVAFALVDCAQPDDGLPLAEWMVQRGIRCALVIDRDERALRKAALDVGCTDVLAKPVAAEAVARVLARLCSDTGALAPIRPRVQPTS